MQQPFCYEIMACFVCIILTKNRSMKCFNKFCTEVDETCFSLSPNLFFGFFDLVKLLFT